MSEEEAILETKQALRSKRRATPSSQEDTLPSASMFLELECEVKQIQLDSLRRFKELQQQIQVQAKQIQDLQEENKALRATFKAHKR